ncbi:MAG: hypothetical protein ACRCV3_01135 [Desulfovibrionaceae bacterium]
MSSMLLLLVFTSVVECFLLGALIFFYKKIKATENLITNLQSNQHRFISMLNENSSLEHDFMVSFSEHIKNLEILDTATQKRILQLEALLQNADSIIHSPQLLRSLIIQKTEEGISKEELSQKMGISLQDIELILTRQ